MLAFGSCLLTVDQLHKDSKKVNSMKRLFGGTTFIMDRGYDNNKMFLKLDELKLDYVIRLTTKRKQLYGKWIPATNNFCHVILDYSYCSNYMQCSHPYKSHHLPKKGV